MSRVNKKNLKKTIIGESYTYKDLCEMGVFDKYYKGGNSKQAQLVELATYCEYEKTGYKYKIIQIFDKPINLLNDTNRNEYRENIQLLILDRLEQMKNLGYHMVETPMKICEEISLVNDNFRKIMNALYNNSQEELEFIAGQFGKTVTPKTLRFVIGTIQRMVIPILRGALDSLRKEGTIVFEEKFKCCKLINGEKVICHCKDEEKELMLNTEDDVKKALGIESKKEFIKNPNLKAKFEKKCKEVYIQHGILYFFTAWDIKATKRTIESGKTRISKELQAKAKKELNENIVNGVNNTLENQCDNMTEKYKPKKTLGKDKEDRQKQTGLKSESQEPDFKDKCQDIGTKVTSRRTRKKIKTFDDVPEGE